MKEHPILFKPDMVAAILKKQKFQTRRIIKPQPMTSEKERMTWLNRKDWWICPAHGFKRIR
jgi:hypothetical protein